MPAVLTYHSQNIDGNCPASNDHHALAADLRALNRAGFRIQPLDVLINWLEGENAAVESRSVFLTFDDGCDFDVRDIEWPGHGLQRSFTGILQDFQSEYGMQAQPELHATSFVIASSDARRVIDAGSLFGRGWISDDWWRECDRNGLLAIENHGWDHNHPDLDGDDRGRFCGVDDLASCLEQVVRAAGAIAELSGRWPRYFAYPFGESSPYIREEFFPRNAEMHGCRAAFGTLPGPVTLDSDRWNLPRYVCRRDWNAPESLLRLIES